MRKYILILFLLFAANVFSENLFRTGDLLFQTEGSGDFSQAISSSTRNADSLSFVHVAILIVGGDGELNVIEASAEKGVRIVSMKEFLETSPTVNGRPGVVVKRLKTRFNANETVARAMEHLGEPYDWWYMPDNGKMYCSELVYEAFLAENGEHIFRAAPMNFRNPDGSMPKFWEELYQELGVPVPEGLPGTNPNDMSADERLVEIHRFF